MISFFVFANLFLANTSTVDADLTDEQTCIIHATEIRRKLVPPQYAQQSADLYPKYAALCTFNAAYDECMNKRGIPQ